MNVFSLQSDVDIVLGLLNEDVPVVGIVAREHSSGWPVQGFGEVAAAMQEAGFAWVEDTSLADELIAIEYRGLVAREPDKPMIRSTCPAVVALLETYHPDMCQYLAPVGSAMAVAGRLVRKVNNGQVHVVYVGPCVAGRVEKDWYEDRPVDAALTFSELDEIISKRRELRQAETVVSSPWTGKRVVVRASRSDNAFAGDSAQSAIPVIGHPEFAAMLQKVRVGKSDGLIDVLGCSGCAGSPMVGSAFEWQEAQRFVHETSAENGGVISIGIEEILPALPAVDVSRVFLPRELIEQHPSRLQLDEILRAGGRYVSEARLDCGGCGYSTCEGLAAAIYDGRSGWSACFPEQRDNFVEHTRELKEASRTDALTELLNHRGFMERLREESQRSKRYGMPMSLVMIDVDHFKIINDTYGHVQGDRVLRLVSQVLEVSLRATDIPARYGGDEFAVILPQTRGSEALEVAEKLRSRAEKTTFYIDEDHYEKLTLSLGVYETDGDLVDPIAIISKADRAMYMAKKNGRNRVSLAE